MSAEVSRGFDGWTVRVAGGLTGWYRRESDARRAARAFEPDTSALDRLFLILATVEAARLALLGSVGGFDLP